MDREMFTDSALPDEERIPVYKIFAVAFSYPDDKLKDFFSFTAEEKKELILEYDRLFRASNI